MFKSPIKKQLIAILGLFLIIPIGLIIALEIIQAQTISAPSRCVEEDNQRIIGQECCSDLVSIKIYSDETCASYIKSGWYCTDCGDGICKKPEDKCNCPEDCPEPEHQYHCDSNTGDGYAPGPGNQGCTPHSSDYRVQDWTFDVFELMRLLAFHKTDPNHEYHCASSSEIGYDVDGYNIGPGSHDCTPHSADYKPQDWKISIDEYNRVMSLYRGLEGVPPMPPSNVSATAISETRVDLTWADGSNDETGFKIKRRLARLGVGSGDYTLIDTVDADITSYIDNSASRNTAYRYCIAAYNDAGESTCTYTNVTTLGEHAYHCDDAGPDGYAPGPGRQTCTPHSSDYRVQDWTFDVFELMRLIGLYKADPDHEYHCVSPSDPDYGEDGYTPGPGSHTCTPHSSDYNPQDWKISVDEYNRVQGLYEGKEEIAQCIKQGERIVEGQVCCSGLKQISYCEESGTDKCACQQGIGGYCTNCGDGVCKSPENKCNCSEDCKKTPSTSFTDGTLIKLADNPKVYVITNSQKQWIKSPEEFNQAGYKWSDVQEVSSSVIESYTDYPELKSNLLRVAGDPKIYYITESGMRRHLLNPAVFISYDNKWENVVEVSAVELNTYPDSALIRVEGGIKVYKLENNQKRWIKTAQAFNRLGYDWTKIAPVNSTELNAYPTGSEIE